MHPQFKRVPEGGARTAGISYQKWSLYGTKGGLNNRLIRVNRIILENSRYRGCIHAVLSHEQQQNQHTYDTRTPAASK